MSRNEYNRRKRHEYRGNWSNDRHAKEREHRFEERGLQKDIDPDLPTWMKKFLKTRPPKENGEERER